MKLKKLLAVLLCAALMMMSLTGFAFAEAVPVEEPFAQWNADAPALNALTEYVEAVTDPDSPDFIPAADRVATFDMDGTLIGELFPTYLEVVLLTERILGDPSWQPDEEMLEFGRMLRDHALDKSFPDDIDYQFSHHQARAFAGMTLQEYTDFITRVLVREVDGFTGMTYADAYYQPMAEVVEYLRDNGFKCYIVSGSDRFIVRTFMEGALDIPADNIIGSDTALAARNQGDADGIEYVFTGEDELVRTDRLLIKDLKTNKVVQIAQEIGKKPVLSFGNSSGDVSMNNYALLNNPYRSAAFMLVADDNARDYGNPDNHDGLTEKWQGMGYNVISMRDDWKTIYGEDVVKTGEFHWLSDYADKPDDESASTDYTLEQVVVLSRHNLRAPLSSNGSVPSDLTPHEWIKWSAGSSELTLKGGIEETSMGQYFRKWLDQEGLIPENTVPAEGEMRFNARDKQRCRATARYFAGGMLPLADIEVEYPGDAKGTEDFMQPVLHFYSDDYAADAIAQVAAMGGDAGFDGLARQNRDVIELIMDTVDMQDSEIYRSGKYGDILASDYGYAMEPDKEPDLTGAIRPAYSVADALLLQYYEEPDAVKAAFGHELTDADWARLGAFMTTCLEIKHGAPLVAANITNPLLRELESELRNEDRKFSFFCAHDCTVLGVLSALGAEDYSLPESIETRTPIGVKLVFERRRDAEGKAWYRVSLIYRSTEQIRSGEMLTLQNPPLRYDLRFEGVETNADGLIAEADLFALFDRTIAVLGELEKNYAPKEAAGEALSQWNADAPALNALIDYVGDVTDPDSPDFIPQKDRIAVFDLDGTLMCETDPFCFEYMVFADYALNHADAMPEDVLAVAREIEDAAGNAKPSGMSTRQAAAAAIAYKGMTMDELAQVVSDFKDSEAWGFTGMTRGEAWFRPMVELVEMLQDNGFEVYVVTATERNIVREIVNGTLDIPPSHVIGTEYGYVATNQGDAADADYTFQTEDQIVFDGNYYGENAKTSKVDAIVREIGQQPVLAFGNSSGDLAMEIYTISNNPYRSAAYMVVADDGEREYGNADSAAEKKSDYESMGIGVISMRDDFATIFGDGVEKAEH